jgi:cytochrome c553
MKSFTCALAVLAGCQTASGSEPTPNPPAQRFEHDMLVRFHMHENFGLLRAIELLLVRGKLDDARPMARAIAEAPDEPGLEPFAARIADVRAQAAALAQASTTADALRVEARLAQRCAACHADASALPEFAEPPRTPPDTGSVAARMARHRWATDRLWEGVVGDSAESWRAGLEVLSAAPLPAAELGGERAAVAQRLRELADRSRQSDNRARDYGEILTMCAACHASAPSHDR